MKYVMTAFFVFLIVPAIGIAREPVEISSANGEGFSISRSGKNLDFSSTDPDVLDMPLLDGDLIVTDENTVVELRLKKYRGTINLTGSTSLYIESLSGDEDNGVIHLNHGRIHVDIKGSVARSRFWVVGRDTVVGVRGTNFGYETIYNDQDGEWESIIYCFEGGLDVFHTGSEGPKAISKLEIAKLDPLQLQANQMVRVSSSTPMAALRAEAIPSTINSVWDEDTLIPTTIDSLPSESSSVLAPELSVGLTDDRKKRRRLLSGQIFLMVGIGSVVAGTLIIALSPTTDDLIKGISYGMIGVGVAGVFVGTNQVNSSLRMP